MHGIMADAAIMLAVWEEEPEAARVPADRGSGETSSCHAAGPGDH